MKTVMIGVVLIAATGLTACEFVPFTPQNQIASAKAKIAIHSANPTTIQWSDVQEYRGAVCGVFNAQERTASYGTELEWSGPRYFVTIKGEPNVVDNYSDCEEAVGAYSRCANEGDGAKVQADVQACKDFQAENLKQSNEQMDRFFKSEGLFQTGDFDRDRLTWDERQKQFDKGPQGLHNPELSAQVDSWTVWKQAYNAHMRTLPANATTAQKVAAAGPAVAVANAATEEFLEAKGFR